MKEPLVSVVVIAFNSADYIVETLDSIKAQSYQTLELIVSDDCSTDLTALIVTDWIAQNEGRFERSNFVTSKINTGISANGNRGAKNCSGEFIKFIAGDDLLLPNCITDLVDFMVANGLHVACSKVGGFGVNAPAAERLIYAEEVMHRNFYESNQDSQYRQLLVSCPVLVVLGAMYSSRLFSEVGGFNEAYPMMEDYPYLVRVSELGYKFRLLDTYTVKYRVRADPNTASFRGSKRAQLHFHNVVEFRSKEIFPRLMRKKMYGSVAYLQIVQCIRKLEFYRGNPVIRWIGALGRRIRRIGSQRGKGRNLIHLFKRKEGQESN